MNPILDKYERLLLSFIKYAPIFFVVILLILTLLLLDREHNNNLNYQIKQTSEMYKKFNTVEIKEEVDKLYSYVSFVEANSHNILKESLKSRVYEAHGIIKSIYEHHQYSKSKAEITALIKDSLSNLRFNNGRGYYFIYELSGENILHPIENDLGDKNLFEYKTKNDVPFFKNLHERLGNQGEVFFSWFWEKSRSASQTHEKQGFFKRFEPYGWFIGTAEYIDEFQKQQQLKTLEYIQNTNIKKDKYAFIVDYSGNTLVHMNKNLIGTNQLNTISKYNFPFIKAFIETAKKGEGFISYYLPKGSKINYKKTSFIKGFDKWQWAIGYGYNDQDLQWLIEQKVDSFTDDENKRYESILTSMAVLAILLLAISVLVSYILKNRFLNYKQQIKDEENAVSMQRIENQKIYKELFENAEVSIWNEDFTEVYKFFELLKSQGVESLEVYLDKYPEMVQQLAQKVKVNEVNNATLKLFNAKGSKRFIYTIQETFGVNALGVFKKELLAIWNEEETFREEANFKSLDGSDIYAIISFQIPKSKEDAISVPVTILDITEIKRKDNLLFQQSKMAAMGEMIGNIAHQWRQPLSIISTISSGIRFQKEYNNLNDEELFESMDNIHEASMHLSQTIEDFRNFFNIEKEKMPFSMLVMVNRTIKLTEAQFKNRGITIISDMDEFRFNGYENELIQVVMNLLNNARDAFEQQVSEHKYIFIEARESADSILLTVKDSAGGIPEDIIGRVFEPYFTTKHQSQGTGIGLYMSEEIVVKHMGGRISVDNEVFSFENQGYKGAKFTMILPKL